MKRSATAEDAAPEAPEGLNPGLTAGFVGPKARLLWNLLSSRMGDALEPYGLRTGAFSAMALISANPGCSQTELARELGIDKSAFVAVLDELEERGLATRQRLPHDRRRHALWMTSEGEALMRRMHQSILAAGQPIRDDLTPEELAQLLYLMDRAYRALARAGAQAAGVPSPKS